MNEEFETVAFVKTTRGLRQIPVIVTYDQYNGKPEIYGVFEKADPSNDLTTLISKAEHALIYFKIEREINATQIEAAEALEER